MINTYSSLRLEDEGLIPEDTALVLHPQDTVDTAGRTLLMLLRVACFSFPPPTRPSDRKFLSCCGCPAFADTQSMFARIG